MTSYTDSLFAIAQGKPAVAGPPLSPPTDIFDAGSWLCCFWKDLAEAMSRPESPIVPTRHSVEAFAPTRHSVEAFAPTRHSVEAFAPTRHSVEAFAPTRHGIDAVVDELYSHPVFQETLSHAADINEHFALSYLPTTPPAFQALWTHVILPATHHHVTVHRLVTSSS
jgi:hypothetical protein